MTTGSFDPEIMQDFLTESGELLERLEVDLVALEATPTEPELLNTVFRALHTIKGSASFLSLTHLVAIAHVAESVLNSARSGSVVIDARAMNQLLAAVDLIKEHMAQIRAGESLSSPDPRLVDSLRAIGEGRGELSDPRPAGLATSTVTPHTDGSTSRPLALGEGKRDLLEFLLSDLDETIGRIAGCAGALGADASAHHSAEELSELAESLARSVDYFEMPGLTRLARSLGEASTGVNASVDPAVLAHLIRRIDSIVDLLRRTSEGLRRGVVLEWPIDTLCARISALARGELPDTLGAPPGSAEDASRMDGVFGAAGPSASAGTGTPATDKAAPVMSEGGPGEAAAGHATDVSPSATASTPAESPPQSESGTRADAAPGHNRAKGNAAGKPGDASVHGDQTIRVEVGRLEALMNLVGELVLQKNRVNALARRVSLHSSLDPDLRDGMGLAACDLDRVTGDIQVAVMRTRMQPLDKIFGRYPRLIRDLAGKTGKKIHLVIEGGETEVDKSVIEELGDPLVHLMRNSADHGLEPPEERQAAGKGDTGTIRLRASHEGSHVRIEVGDDGRGLIREKIARKALERGLVTEAELPGLSDREVFRFIFEAGFSTASQVSDLSGRGVGLDVVRTNVLKLKGSVDLDSAPGTGTTFVITIPLTVAIMTAMMVGVGQEIYAVPLDSIIEIVRPRPEEMSTIRSAPVMRLRDAVLPLIDAGEAFHQPAEQRKANPFAVVLANGDRRVGLMVSRLIGQQEIVIKPLDGAGQDGPLSGATVRDDGGVSLIVDVPRLIKLGEDRVAA
ncbi:MAG: chemotaxis protein CheA [Phycisphaerales bacterium]|nr:chemotaxis protein CheA [Phycisphaerales bacterium]